MTPFHQGGSRCAGAKWRRTTDTSARARAEPDRSIEQASTCRTTHGACERTRWRGRHRVLVLSDGGEFRIKWWTDLKRGTRFVTLVDGTDSSRCSRQAPREVAIRDRAGLKPASRPAILKAMTTGAIVLGPRRRRASSRWSGGRLDWTAGDPLTNIAALNRHVRDERREGVRRRMTSAFFVQHAFSSSTDIRRNPPTTKTDTRAIRRGWSTPAYHPSRRGPAKASPFLKAKNPRFDWFRWNEEAHQRARMRLTGAQNSDRMARPRTRTGGATASPGNRKAHVVIGTSLAPNV